MSFAHLHVHSCFSFREGAIRPHEIAEAAAAMEMPAIALTDHLGVPAAVRFTRACRAVGVRPVLGAELVVRPPGGVPDPSRSRPRPEDPRAHGRARRRAPLREDAPDLVAGRRGTPNLRAGNHIVLLAADATGWGNLCRLITHASFSWVEGVDPGPEVPWEVFAAHAEGLVVLSGCDRGEVRRWLHLGDLDAATRAAGRYASLLGRGRYYLEASNHLLPGSRRLLDGIEVIARRLGVDVVATNDVHYVQRSQAVVHELLVAMRDLAPLTPARQRRRSAEYDLKSPAVMRRIFPGRERWCDATLEVVDRCDFELDLEAHHLPDITPNETLARLAGGRLDADVPGDSEWASVVLERACREGLRRRPLPGSAPGAIEGRLRHELGVIRDLGFCGYFLLVAEIVEHIRTMGIRVACRGSAAGSLVVHLLGVSDVDPVAHDLCFARFLNKYRRTLPDVDIDVESHRRDEILEWVMDRFGADRTAMVAAVDTYRARSAIREVGKALGLPPGEVGTLAKLFPHIRASAIPQALAELPELADVHLEVPHVQQLFELCAAIDGFPRHLSLHPCGVLIGPSDFGELVPLEPSPDGLPMAQFDKDDVDELGLVKLDVLGVRMQSAISHALAEVERVTGRAVDVDRVAWNDPATFALASSTHTLGCFQIESPGQRELLGRFQPDRFEDLIVDISLFRPGPVKSNMVGHFVDRRNGREALSYPSSILEPVLAETNGVIVYHEQVIRTIARLCGISEAEAESVRRRLGEPDDPEMVEIGEWVRAEARTLGLAPEEADAVWAELASFASFGFCKAHAAAFAVPTYQSAWLKAHHPAAFLAGVLTHEPGMYHRRLFVHEARRFGVPVLGVDVNRSRADDAVEAVGDPVVADPRVVRQGSNDT